MVLIIFAVRGALRRRNKKKPKSEYSDKAITAIIVKNEALAALHGNVRGSVTKNVE